MTSDPSWLRRVSVTLVRHAAGMLAGAQYDWSMAMRHEIEHIDDDRAAFKWAIGCVIAAYRQRLMIAALLRVAGIRFGVTGVIGLAGLSSVFDASLPLAYRFRLNGLMGPLGLLTEGDNDRRYIDLMTQLPSWAPGLSVAAGILYFAAATQVLMRNQWASICFSMALGLNLVDGMILKNLPAYAQAFSARHAWHDELFFGVLLLLAVALMGAFRPPRQPPSASARI